MHEFDPDHLLPEIESSSRQPVDMKMEQTTSSTAPPEGSTGLMESNLDNGNRKFQFVMKKPEEMMIKCNHDRKEKRMPLKRRHDADPVFSAKRRKMDGDLQCVPTGDSVTEPVQSLMVEEGMEAVASCFSEPSPAPGPHPQLEPEAELTAPVALPLLDHNYSRKQKHRDRRNDNQPYVKKPPNAFILFLMEQRPIVKAEFGLIDSAAVNVELGKRWRSLTNKGQEKYFEQARAEAWLHADFHPGWSTLDNYGTKRPGERAPTKPKAEASQPSTTVLTASTNVSETQAVAAGAGEHPIPVSVPAAPPSNSCNSRKQKRRDRRNNNQPYVKKPPNAFILFLKEQRPIVKAELRLTDSAALNVELGKRWTSLTNEDQEKYFVQARAEARLHAELHPDWSPGCKNGTKRPGEKAPTKPKTEAPQPPTTVLTASTNVWETQTVAAGAGEHPIPVPIPAAPPSNSCKSKKQMCRDRRNDNQPYVKKPANAFILFLKEQRPIVKAELGLTNSAAVNVELGKRWTSLTNEGQEKYFVQARVEARLHAALYPDWSPGCKNPVDAGVGEDPIPVPHPAASQMLVCQPPPMAAPSRFHQAPLYSQTGPQSQGHNLQSVGDLNGQLPCPLIPAAPPSNSCNSRKQKRCDRRNDNQPYVKKPPNAFMLFLKEQRPIVTAELRLTDSAAVNAELGKRWTSLPNEKREKYIEQARADARLHAELHPDWSAGCNYGTKKTRERAPTKPKPEAPQPPSIVPTASTNLSVVQPVVHQLQQPSL